MPLFDSRVRVDPTPSSGQESTFQFLDRVSTPYFREVRRALNRWVDNYPAQEREELVGRLRDTSGSFRDAFWELWLYTAYRGAGFEVEIHPRLIDSTRRPDFAVSCGDFAAYLEARVVTGTSARSVAKENLLHGLIEAFNRGDHPDFRLALSVLRQGAGQPSAKALRTRVLRWLDSLDVEAVTAQGPPLPRHVEIDRDWEFRFSALPIGREKRGSSVTPLISVRPGGSFVGDAASAFRKAVAQKGSRYGLAADPLIVAIQIEEPWTRDDDLESALYGRTSRWAERSDPGLNPGEVQRLGDGYWTPEHGRRVAAVLTARKVRPWGVSHSRPRLWVDPFRDDGLAHPRIWRRGSLQRDRLGVRWDDPPQNEIDRWFGVANDWPSGPPFPR